MQARGSFHHPGSLHRGQEHFAWSAERGPSGEGGKGTKGESRRGKRIRWRSER